jgi:hypothetical protein
MKVFYIILTAIYLGWLVWYGGSGNPLTIEEASYFKDQMTQSGEIYKKDVTEPLMYMDHLIESDDGNEFIMVNLIKFRAIATYPPGSQWAGETDPGLADSRYGEAILPLLLKRASLPILTSSVNGKFINDGGDNEWDMVALVRYRSVRDMLDMMLEMSTMDIIDHKWAAIERTHVFPVKPRLSLISLRLILAMILVLIAVFTTYLLNLKKSKNLIAHEVKGKNK